MDETKMHMDQSLIPTVLFEDDDICVISKPAGLVVNRAETVVVPTLQDWCEAQSWYPKNLVVDAQKTQEELRDDPIFLFQSRSGIAHRLDKDTSGCLILAKHPAALAHLLKQFQSREVHKEYLALVHGKMQERVGIIHLPLARNSRNRQSFAVDASGRESETAYHVISLYSLPPATVSKRDAQSYSGFSFVRVMPKTGRTHQIRVHMHHVHHPLVSDSIYGGRKRLRIDVTWCPRLFLHAEKISFIHPKTEERVSFMCPLLSDLQQVLDSIEKANSVLQS